MSSAKQTAGRSIWLSCLGKIMSEHRVCCCVCVCWCVLAGNGASTDRWAIVESLSHLRIVRPCANSFIASRSRQDELLQIDRETECHGSLVLNKCRTWTKSYSASKSIGYWQILRPFKMSKSWPLRQNLFLIFRSNFTWNCLTFEQVLKSVELLQGNYRVVTLTHQHTYIDRPTHRYWHYCGMARHELIIKLVDQVKLG